MIIEKDNDSKNRLIPMQDWNKYHPWPPHGGLRHLVFKEKTNGFDKVVKRASGRVLIDEQAFFKWVEERTIVEAELLAKKQQEKKQLKQSKE